jgi:hypothetical protein
MPDPLNFEFLRKEAKSILKLCRSRDANALARIRPELPRIAGMDDEHAAAALKLADVQYALARASGFENWSELKRHQFSKSGADGMTLPAGFDAWRFGVSYTVRPEILAPLSYGREYRMFVRVIRKIPNGEKFSGYSNLYQRAMVISNSRTAQLHCAENGAAVRTRVLAHGWWANDTLNLATSYLTIGVSCLKDGDPIPRGQPMPTPEALTEPGGLTPQSYTPADVAAQKQIDENYSVFDNRDSSKPISDVSIFSYGEYVPICDGLDYSPFIERAETLAKTHAALSGGGKIVRREWFSVTNPNIAVVHIYVQQVTSV